MATKKEAAFAARQPTKSPARRPPQESVTVLPCRKLTGSTYLAFLSFPAENFNFTADEPKTLTITHEAGIPITASSCASCGTGLAKTAGNDPTKIVFAGTVDDGGKAISERPQLELWTKYRLDWCEDVGKGGMMGFEGFPPPSS